jgi:hypothetical protein
MVFLLKCQVRSPLDISCRVAGNFIAGRKNIQALLVRKPGLVVGPFATAYVYVVGYFLCLQTVFQVASGQAAAGGMSDQIDLCGTGNSQHFIDELNQLLLSFFIAAADAVPVKCE